jgi:hypothetical protein
MCALLAGVPHAAERERGRGEEMGGERCVEIVWCLEEVHMLQKERRRGGVKRWVERDV